MKKSFKSFGFLKLANTQVNRLEQFDKLKEIANRDNYPHKLKQLTAKVQSEYDFWNLKNPSQKLEDITEDLIFIKSQTNDNLDTKRIDVLIEKYGLK